MRDPDECRRLLLHGNTMQLTNTIGFWTADGFMRVFSTVDRKTGSRMRVLCRNLDQSLVVGSVSDTLEHCQICLSFKPLFQAHSVFHGLVVRLWQPFEFRDLLEWKSHFSGHPYSMSLRFDGFFSQAARSMLLRGQDLSLLTLSYVVETSQKYTMCNE
ncbi:hypothetical protein GQ43DRAFT_445489 [Delitschia confertaspora ATCC 74209]|uniref:Uncharacterized protein n=1 Tax=Delitschia confertaspora ATCC 74209 TaxID=1513339 RepID=A0A9P4JBC8_9PLEO|nr:hypothetical protein GQ43DRAFT_445489 [Delitschia confertaspora ATCC 74209]